MSLRLLVMLLGAVLLVTACTPTLTPLEDVVPPEVLSVSPAHQSTSVARDAIVTVTFSEAMDRTAAENAFGLNGSAALTGSFAWTAGDTVLSFVPTAALEAQRAHTVIVAATACDVAGNSLAAAWTSTFTTVAPDGPPPDTTPPAVDSVVPANGATGVAPGGSVVVTFSEAMDTAATEGAFSLTGSGAVTGIVSWSTDETVLTFTPNDVLAFYGSYSVGLGTGAHDKAGNALAAPFASSFMTPAPSGALDTSFGTAGTGLVVTDGTATEVAYAVTVDVQGRAIVAGYRKVGSAQDMAVRRFLPSGAPDTSFGTGGLMTHDGAVVAGEAESARAVCLDTAGRIVVVGNSQNSVSGESASQMVIWRLTATGSLDSSFGSGGWVVAPHVSGNPREYGNGVVVGSSDGIVATGYTRSSGSNLDMVIWRYTSGGVPDASFGVSGVVVGPDQIGGSGATPPCPEQGAAVAFDSSGRILVAGSSYSGTNFKQATVWRYSSLGALDSGFGAGGVALSAASLADANGYGLAVDGAGRILVAGQGQPTGSWDGMVWCFTSGGSLDGTFGTSGALVLSDMLASGVVECANGVAIDAAGKAMVVGSATSSTLGGVMMAWRLADNGSIDPGFASTAWADYRAGIGLADADDDVSGIAIDTRGRILVVGTRNPGVATMALWRLK